MAVLAFSVVLPHIAIGGEIAFKNKADLGGALRYSYGGHYYTLQHNQSSHHYTWDKKEKLRAGYKYGKHFNYTYDEPLAKRFDGKCIFIKDVKEVV